MFYDIEMICLIHSTHNTESIKTSFKIVRERVAKGSEVKGVLSVLSPDGG